MDVSRVEPAPRHPVRAWCFTVFNPTDDVVVEVLKLADYDSVKRLAVGREVCPQTGTPHLQGYIRLSRAVRFAGIKKLLPAGAHVEARRAVREADASKYCLKDGNVLINHGVDCDADTRRPSRYDEADQVIAEIESGAGLGLIRSRHKQFYFWWRSNVVMYKRDEEQLAAEARLEVP